MTARADDTTLLARLSVHLAAVVPSGLAADRASLEWQVLREVWLEALDRLGFCEDQARAAARGIARRDLDATIAALMGGANEP